VSAPLLADARAALAADPDGHLARPLRQAILRALGDGDDGRARRARLARATAEHVLPLWQAERPGDDDPQRALEMITGVLAGEIGEADARAAAGTLWAHVDNLVMTAGEEPGLHAGYAASKALMAAIGDEPLDPPGAALEDQGRDPRRLDTAFIAAGAVAAGPPWKAGSDATARRDFWSWWIDLAAQPHAGG
jgi:hypothetical protein